MGGAGKREVEGGVVSSTGRETFFFNTEVRKNPKDERETKQFRNTNHSFAK